MAPMYHGKDKGKAAERTQGTQGGRFFCVDKIILYMLPSKGVMVCQEPQEKKTAQVSTI